MKRRQHRRDANQNRGTYRNHAPGVSGVNPPVKRPSHTGTLPRTAHRPGRKRAALPATRLGATIPGCRVHLIRSPAPLVQGEIRVIDEAMNTPRLRSANSVSPTDASPATLINRVITRYHPVLSVPASTIRGMAGDQETVTAAAAVAAGGELVPRAGARPPGPVAIAAELLARTRAELPVLAGLGEREELLAAAWLASLRAARTRRAYAADVRGWLGWLTERGTDVLDAGRVHVDLWAAGQQDQRRGSLPACGAGYQRCPASTATAPPTTWSTGSRRRGWRGRWWIRTTPPPSAWTATRCAPWSRPPTPTRGRRRCGQRR